MKLMIRDYKNTIRDEGIEIAQQSYVNNLSQGDIIISCWVWGQEGLGAHVIVGDLKVNYYYMQSTCRDSAATSN